ncbi:MAG: MlaD family protein [Fuerstiella sp.]
MNQPQETPETDSAVATAEENSPPQSEFPVAEVKDAASAPAVLRLSKMWWLTLLCLLLAIGLVWNSLPERGPEITIQFPEGHGLKPKDAVRYRGIEVGTVSTVTLDETLSAVEVLVTLKPGAELLNREGTRFWIVRPRFSLTEISGLETAVGAKYIGVSPGDPTAQPRKNFEGLTAPPPDEFAESGLKLILRSDDRRGLSVGSPVTWRGVDVGQVLTVNLSADARHVDVTVRMHRRYHRLVRRSSKFWITSGFDVDVSLSGVKLNAQSLGTMIRGGISLITPTEGNDAPIGSGHVFPLAMEPEDEWLEAASTVPLIDFHLPETVLVQGIRRTSVFGIPRSRPYTQVGMLIIESTGTTLLTAELPLADDAEDSTLAEFQIQTPTGESATISNVSLADCQRDEAGSLRVPVEVAGFPTAAPNLFRVPTEPEECIAVRTAASEDRSMPVIQSIDWEQLSPAGQTGVWAITGGTDFSASHGAPVVATADGKIIGVLLNGRSGPVVAPLTKDER